MVQAVFSNRRCKSGVRDGSGVSWVLQVCDWAQGGRMSSVLRGKHACSVCRLKQLGVAISAGAVMLMRGLLIVSGFSSGIARGVIVCPAAAA